MADKRPVRLLSLSSEIPCSNIYTKGTRRTTMDHAPRGVETHDGYRLRHHHYWLGPVRLNGGAVRVARQSEGVAVPGLHRRRPVDADQRRRELSRLRPRGDGSRDDGQV